MWKQTVKVRNPDWENSGSFRGDRADENPTGGRNLPPQGTLLSCLDAFKFAVSLNNNFCDTTYKLILLSRPVKQLQRSTM